ncbi:uncharacterized protein LOC131046702 [Cryptomeria japonica]|uniref:uncharacterized protein LOC131046702 n=1 Tax=Cryptomeria japonica TaxID=3369 RepID=UPI0025AC93C8|nr:uncharacterized protein LOC131046702 [Cryptomeria japonica]
MNGNDLEGESLERLKELEDKLEIGGMRVRSRREKLYEEIAKKNEIHTREMEMKKVKILQLEEENSRLQRERNLVANQDLIHHGEFNYPLPRIEQPSNEVQSHESTCIPTNQQMHNGNFLYYGEHDISLNLRYARMYS